MDGESIVEFERDLTNNLYKLWNRMSSGNYFPPPVRAVEIPKSDGGKRALGIPTVSDRVAQMVAKMYLEPRVEPHFHQDSYGYRPARSAIQAVGVPRQRCWRIDWVLDLDIKGCSHNLRLRSCPLAALRDHQIAAVETGNPVTHLGQVVPENSRNLNFIFGNQDILTDHVNSPFPEAIHPGRCQGSPCWCGVIVYRLDWQGDGNPQAPAGRLRGFNLPAKTLHDTLTNCQTEAAASPEPGFSPYQPDRAGRISG